MVMVLGSKKEMQAQLTNGRIMPLKDLIMEPIVSKLKVGKWFRIDRNVIDENRDENYRKCIEAGPKGKALWERFEKSEKIADENPDQYPRVMEVYILKHDWDYKNEQEIRDRCEQVGEGMCDEVICDFELQMRICNGEAVKNLVEKDDKLPNVRVITFRDGGIGYFGGGDDLIMSCPPAYLRRLSYFPNHLCDIHVPYAFRKVVS